MNSIVTTYRGRDITTSDVVFIQQLIAANPTLSRRALSQKLCEAWNWRQANGHLRDMVCRSMMLLLHRAGHINLPPIRRVNPNPLARRSQPSRLSKSPPSSSKPFLSKPRAELPKEAGEKKYDVSVGTVIALLKYGTGLPLNRFERLQGNLGIPLPASTQWDLVHAKSKIIKPALDELIRQAAQGDVVHNDDTNSKILAFLGQRAQKAAEKAAAEKAAAEKAAAEKAATEKAAAAEKSTELDCSNSPESSESSESSENEQDPSRTGIFTSGIVSRCRGHDIALFLTGRQHCGENLQAVLNRRAQELSPPIQMCDGLSRNLPKELQTILANCMAHARRNFVDVAEHFEQECRHVIDALKVIYKNDAEAKKENMTPEARLAFHHLHSKETMDSLHQWLGQQFAERLVEPNSGLGQSITYMLNRWDQLTLFLRKAGAPLDNNICERALKKAILHRKNSLFFVTQNGANVSDLFMSLIYTCELNGVNPFDYLNELERHAEALAADPSAWMPWNFRAALEGVASAQAPTAA